MPTTIITGIVFVPIKSKAKLKYDMRCFVYLGGRDIEGDPRPVPFIDFSTESAAKDELDFMKASSGSHKLRDFPIHAKEGLRLMDAMRKFAVQWREAKAEPEQYRLAP